MTSLTTCGVIKYPVGNQPPSGSNRCFNRLKSKCSMIFYEILFVVEQKSITYMRSVWCGWRCNPHNTRGISRALPLTVSWSLSLLTNRCLCSPSGKMSYHHFSRNPEAARYESRPVMSLDRYGRSDIQQAERHGKIQHLLWGFQVLTRSEASFANMDFNPSMDT